MKKEHKRNSIKYNSNHLQKLWYKLDRGGPKKKKK